MLQRKIRYRRVQLLAYDLSDTPPLEFTPDQPQPATASNKPFPFYTRAFTSQGSAVSARTQPRRFTPRFLEVIVKYKVCTYLFICMPTKADTVPCIALR